jgi:hypothetical protein
VETDAQEDRMLKITSAEIEEALRNVLGSFGLDHVELKEGYDHDGDAAVFVTAMLKPDKRLIPGDISASASVAVAEVLEQAGDDRFSYLYLKHPDDERPVDDEAATSPS